MIDIRSASFLTDDAAAKGGPPISRAPKFLLEGKFYGVITLLLIMSLYDVMQVKIASSSLKHMT